MLRRLGALLEFGVSGPLRQGHPSPHGDAALLSRFYSRVGWFAVTAAVQYASKFRNLRVNRMFLCLETCNSGIDDFGCEFLRHILIFNSVSVDVKLFGTSEIGLHSATAQMALTRRPCHWIKRNGGIPIRTGWTGASSRSHAKTVPRGVLNRLRFTRRPLVKQDWATQAGSLDQLLYVPKNSLSAG